MTTKREPPISIRIDRENLAKVKAAAALEGKTLSGFVKDAAVAAAEYRIQETAAASAGRSMERALTPATGVVEDPGRTAIRSSESVSAGKQTFERAVATRREFPDESDPGPAAFPGSRRRPRQLTFKGEDA